MDFDKDVVIDRPLMREGDESSRVVRVKHPILDAASTARAIKIPLKEYLQNLPSSQRWPLNKWLGLKFSQWTSNFSETGILKILDYRDRFESYKKSLGAIDYADMLERSIEESAGLPDFDLLIVDEAQDLTPVQWDLVKILISRSKRTYIAGDDDQAICEPFGAGPVSSFDCHQIRLTGRWNNRNASHLPFILVLHLWLKGLIVASPIGRIRHGSPRVTDQKAASFTSMDRSPC